MTNIQDNYQPSDLEREIIRLMRIHRTIAGYVFNFLYPEEKESRALALALRNIIYNRVISYDAFTDIYIATPLDKPDRRKMRAMDFFVALHPDPEDCKTALLNASTSGPYDIAAPSIKGVFEYLIYVNDTPRAIQVTQLAQDIKQSSNNDAPIHLYIVATSEKELRLCKTDGIPTTKYLFEKDHLRKIG